MVKIDQNNLAKTVKRYEPTRSFDDFHLAGFTYYDGLEIIDKLKIGTELQLYREVDNPHDPNAIVIYYEDKKLGYVPADHTALYSTLLYFGHADVFEARINMVNLEEHPAKQFRVVVKVKDKR